MLPSMRAACGTRLAVRFRWTLTWFAASESVGSLICAVEAWVANRVTAYQAAILWARQQSAQGETLINGVDPLLVSIHMEFPLVYSSPTMSGSIEELGYGHLVACLAQARLSGTSQCSQARRRSNVTSP